MLFIREEISSLKSWTMVKALTLGYYFLVLFSPQQGIGLWLQQTLGVQLVFSFSGILVASMIYSLPFTFRPLQSVFEQLPDNLYSSAALLGFKPWRQFVWLVLPMIKPAIYTAATLSFAHTVGEFAPQLVLMHDLQATQRC